MGKVRNNSGGLALLLTGAALALALAGGGGEGPFEQIPHDPSLDMRIDINKAERRDMESLPGVGPVLAERIVQYREAHGPFQKSADLKTVRGIGEGLAGSLEPYIATGETPGSVGALDDEVGGGEEGRVDGRR